MKLDTEKVRAAIPAGIELPPFRGGWADLGKDQERACFMRITTEPATQADQVSVRSLCGRFEGEAKPGELAECDPLAPENCPECRVALLKMRGLI